MPVKEIKVVYREKTVPMLLQNFFCLIMAISISKLVIPMIIIRRNCHLKCGSIIIPTWCPWIVCCELVVFRGLKITSIFEFDVNSIVIVPFDIKRL
nr:hypothetical protein Iba_scaffold33726CG0010 [Ipomoea batatas]